jgi:hypothetical protein
MGTGAAGPLRERGEDGGVMRRPVTVANALEVVAREAARLAVKREERQRKGVVRGTREIGTARRHRQNSIARKSRRFNLRTGAQ